MTDLRRRKLVLASALAGGAALAGLVRPRQAGRAGAQALIEAALPERLGAWHRIALADFVLPPGDALGRSQYDALVLRGYATAAGDPLYCVITYGAVQDYALQLHRPEVCYPASGFVIRELVPYPGPIGQRALGATAMVANRDDRVETVLYWTRVGQAFPRSQWEVREAILGGLARFCLPDGAMVRLSMQRSAQTPLSAAILPLLADFAGELVRGLAGPGRGLLLGEGG